MCGIAGLIDLAGVDDAAASRLDAALERLSRRGPDGSGRWRDRFCVLGHTRLAIIDLSPAGAQPMIGHGFAVTQNGEIYNYRALRDELRARGHAFATGSDTEVLLAGWREWGEGLLPRLVGMFAFALWTPESGELVLVRDRFGKKPLLYRTEGTRLAFASDLLALERLWGASFPLDPEAVRLLFALRYVPEPWSIASDVRKVPAGHIARFSRRGFELRPWYELPRGQARRFRDEGEAAEELRTRLDRAVLDRTVADVPVGAFLSGGLDSSIIVSSLARQTSSVRTFTVGFPGASGYYEERPAARALARHLGTDHNEIEIEANDAREALDGVIDGLDEPFADSSALPAFLLSKATRRHVRVALSGDGADELFGGYRKHLGELYAERYRRLPAWLRRGVIEPAARRLPEGKDSLILE
ncbi:MAG: asparagine synthase (glutamine-hydrolyzing), partial [Alphaproteobacteria bacterium]